MNQQINLDLRDCIALEIVRQKSSAYTFSYEDQQRDLAKRAYSFADYMLRAREGSL